MSYPGIVTRYSVTVLKTKTGTRPRGPLDCDARRMDIVRVSKNDQGMFSQCREIALKLAEELGNSYLPQE